MHFPRPRLENKAPSEQLFFHHEEHEGHEDFFILHELRVLHGKFLSEIIIDKRLVLTGVLRV